MHASFAEKKQLPNEFIEPSEHFFSVFIISPFCGFFIKASPPTLAGFKTKRENLNWQTQMVVHRANGR